MIFASLLSGGLPWIRVLQTDQGLVDSPPEHESHSHVRRCGVFFHLSHRNIWEQFLWKGLLGVGTSIPLLSCFLAAG